MIVYLEKLMAPIKKLELINEVSKVTESMSNIHKSILFIICYQQIFRNVITFTIGSKYETLRNKSSKYIYIRLIH